MSTRNTNKIKQTHIHIHIHTHMYIYIYINQLNTCPHLKVVSYFQSIERSLLKKKKKEKRNKNS